MAEAEVTSSESILPASLSCGSASPTEELEKEISLASSKGSLDSLMTSSSVMNEIRDEALRNYYFMCKGVLGYSKLVPHVHLPLCELLSNPLNTRLRILLPRGWYKSTVASIGYPIWRACNNPNIRILLAQNTSTNAASKLSSIKGKFESCQLLRALFPGLLPDRNCVWRDDAACLRRTESWPEKTFEAAGINTQVTGRHYDLILEDDTVSPDLADLKADNMCPTKEGIQQAIGWHRLVNPLLIDQSKQIVVIGTRWFELDLLSWIETNEPYYKSYCRAVREVDGKPHEDGALTFPEEFNDSHLAQLKQSLGPYMYSCLYMNKPVRSGDMVFDISWFKYYETPPRDVITYTTVDLAGDPELLKGEPDYNVVMTCGKDIRSGHIYVLNYFRERCSPAKVISTIFDHVRKYSPVVVGIESVGYQSTLQGWIRERMVTERTSFRIEPITHGRKSKNFRIQGLQPYFNSLQIFLRPWMKDLYNELVVFPYGANDDLADALSMQVPFWDLTDSEYERQTRRERYYALDPLSLDSALIEYEEKLSQAEGLGLAQDVLKTSPMYYNPYDLTLN